MPKRTARQLPGYSYISIHAGTNLAFSTHHARPTGVMSLKWVGFLPVNLENVLQQPVEQVGFEVVFANMKFVFETCL